LEAEHVEFAVSAQAVLDIFANVVDITDKPVGDSSLVST
jgi:hypothetical protein